MNSLDNDIKADIGSEGVIIKQAARDALFKTLSGLHSPRGIATIKSEADTKKKPAIVEAKDTISESLTLSNLLQFLDFSPNGSNKKEAELNRDLLLKAAAFASDCTTIISHIIQHPCVVLTKESGKLRGVAFDDNGMGSYNAGWYSDACKKLQVAAPTFNLLEQIGNTKTNQYLDYLGGPMSFSETIYELIFRYTSFQPNGRPVREPADIPQGSYPFHAIVKRPDNSTDIFLLALFHETIRLRTNPGFISVNLPDERAKEFLKLYKVNPYVVWAGLLGRAFHPDSSDISNLNRNNNQLPVSPTEDSNFSRQQLFLINPDRINVPNSIVYEGTVQAKTEHNQGQVLRRTGYAGYKGEDKITFPAFIPTKKLYLKDLNK